jgi:hypothetical protein
MGVGMHQQDEFGHDPGVQRTRAYFAHMEALDSRLIDRSGISRFDAKLRPAREMRFSLFESACSLAYKKGLLMDENKTMALFEICQDLAFQKNGLSATPSSTVFDPELVALAKEGVR